MPICGQSIDKVKIAIMEFCSNQRINCLSDCIQLNWPTNQVIEIAHEIKADSHILIVIANNQDVLNKCFTVLLQAKEQKIPIVIISDFELTTSDSELLNATYLTSAIAEKTVVGVLHGILQKQIDLSQQRGQVSLLKKLNGVLKNDIYMLQEELMTAAQMQKEYMSNKTPTTKGIKFDTYWNPANVVSGDIYDIYQLDPEHVSIFIADSIGHGVSAAMLSMIAMRTIASNRFDSVSQKIKSPDKMLEQINSAILERSGTTARFLTAFYGILNTTTNTFAYAGGGHPPAIVSSIDRNIQLLESDGPLLGVFESALFPVREIKLKTGDTTLLYSDGFESIKPTIMIENELPPHIQAMHEICACEEKNKLEEIAHLAEKNNDLAKDDLTLISFEISKADATKKVA